MLSVFITILSMQATYECRGYFVLGGEILTPLIPVMLYIWVKVEDI